MREQANKHGRRPDIVCVEGPRAVNLTPLCGFSVLAGVLTTIDAESRSLPAWRPRCVFRQAGRDQSQRERPTWLERHARLHDLLRQDRCCPLRVTGPQMVTASFSGNSPRRLGTQSNVKRSRFAGDGQQLVPNTVYNCWPPVPRCVLPCRHSQGQIGSGWLVTTDGAATSVTVRSGRGSGG